ncbi:XRE family transcriptional regulator [Streptomyces sp. AC512_CC834]|uniref:XRE family transcriptional regulator n=1 Tax=Streptomyces sp. AC512_CC834 TaxID=2823691 RepID=UPI0020B73833|nr:XRE family transcriptional regulator [Streptomyces sp. AC512_CC834]
MPDELDPQIREFASQLRRLVDRSELSVASVADATGYSKTSWERYLNGRLLAPKGAIVALAEVTGTNPLHLTTMWELAERAWSRSEMRHDMTMEAIRISQARAALGEPGTTAAKSGNSAAKSGHGARNGDRNDDRNGKGSRTGRHGGGAPAATGVAGPAGVAPTLPPTVPVQPTAADSPDSALGAVRDGGAPGAPSGPSAGGATDGNSWGLAGYRGPAPAGDRAARSWTRTGPGEVPGAAGPAAMPGPAAPDGLGPAGAYGEPPHGGHRSPNRSSGGGNYGGNNGGGNGGGNKRMTTFVAGVVGVLVVIAGAFFLLKDGGDKKNEGTKPSPSPTVSSDPQLPPGVKCSGDACTGKDPEVMGCGGDLVTTTATATVGTAAVEVRYSKTCGAAWARVTQAAQGDEVQVTADGKKRQSGTVAGAGDTVAYTPMVAVKSAADAKACVTTAAGPQGCTE